MTSRDWEALQAHFPMSRRTSSRMTGGPQQPTPLKKSSRHWQPTPRSQRERSVKALDHVQMDGTSSPSTPAQAKPTRGGSSIATTAPSPFGECSPSQQLQSPDHRLDHAALSFFPEQCTQQLGGSSSSGTSCAHTAAAVAAAVAAAQAAAATLVAQSPLSPPVVRSISSPVMQHRGAPSLPKASEQRPRQQWSLEAITRELDKLRKTSPQSPLLQTSDSREHSPDKVIPRLPSLPPSMSLDDTEYEMSLAHSRVDCTRMLRMSRSASPNPQAIGTQDQQPRPGEPLLAPRRLPPAGLTWTPDMLATPVQLRPHSNLA